MVCELNALLDYSASIHIPSQYKHIAENLIQDDGSHLIITILQQFLNYKVTEYILNQFLAFWNHFNENEIFEWLFFQVCLRFVIVVLEIEMHDGINNFTLVIQRIVECFLDVSATMLVFGTLDHVASEDAVVKLHS